MEDICFNPLLSIRLVDFWKARKVLYGDSFYDRSRQEDNARINLYQRLLLDI
ncbi:hypothetical protein SAMN04488029_1255 [Reichenbachiella faecimaris]|uniref:Uncharacterized protein n=1 Tax=Reichenbachiella faecimaris TaxID=692418 RepID=A0A1W2G884_REIFA|nr:hypothetical protein SAMN04488029_1255 [Reichenbachiella faecimaris]